MCLHCFELSLSLEDVDSGQEIWRVWCSVVLVWDFLRMLQFGAMFWRFLDLEDLNKVDEIVQINFVSRLHCPCKLQLEFRFYCIGWMV